MSDGLTVGLTDRKTATPTTKLAPKKPTDRPTVRPSVVLASISHPPDFVANVITHQQCSIRRHQQAHGPSPAGAVGTLPANDEILDSHRPMATAVHLDPHNLGTRRHA